MDPSAEAPCRHLTPRFVQGDLQNSKDVIAFGSELDVITIEIEHVSVEGLRELESRGVRVIPKPDHLEIIQDKGKQKAFFAEHSIPTSPFQLVDGAGSRVVTEQCGRTPQRICSLRKLGCSRARRRRRRGIKLVADASPSIGDCVAYHLHPLL